MSRLVTWHPEPREDSPDASASPEATTSLTRSFNLHNSPSGSGAGISIVQASTHRGMVSGRCTSWNGMLPMGTPAPVGISHHTQAQSDLTAP